MIRIKNIYYILTYAFQVLNEQCFRGILTEEFENVNELYSAILINGVSLQIKRGLVKEYNLQAESMSILKGKVDISTSIKHNSMIKKQLVCNYDIFSVNCYVNRIIRTTLEILVKSNISKTRKKELRKILIHLTEVELLNVNKINWKIQFNKNNQTYQMLISICYLVINGLLQTNSDGSTKLMDFFDEQRLCRLYEKFIFEYYKKHHPKLKVSASQINWDCDDGYTDMLPIMQSDIILKYNDKTLIIDAKYYSQTMQQHYNVVTLNSANLYQIYTYVKNYDKDKTGKVSGMLLYAKTDELILPNNSYNISGNTIAVNTLNLDCDFSEIKKTIRRYCK